MRLIHDAWFIYAIFCEIEKDKALVKIGRAKDVYARVMALQPGIPYPIHVVLFARVGEVYLASDIEAAIHRSFESRQTRGEWFLFDLADETDKADFHRLTKAAFRHGCGRELKWSRIVPEQLRAYMSLRAKKLRKPLDRKQKAC